MFYFIYNIINAFFSILKTSAAIIYLNDYFKRMYPQKYEETLIQLSLNLINLYSKCQIVFTKVFKYTNEFSETNPYVKKIIDEIYKVNIVKNEICQIKNTGEIIVKYYTDDKEKYFDYYSNDLYIYSDNKDKCVNKVILHMQPFTSEYEVSDLRFLMVELIISNDTFKIDLKTDEYNYYIVNNILDKKFFVFFLTYYKICNLSNYCHNINSIEKFNIKIIDQNVKIKELEISDSKFIIIKKHDFNY
jgi:hypothetical protein